MNDGGPAFPVPPPDKMVEFRSNGDVIEAENVFHPGMTLRDYFACAALQAYGTDAYLISISDVAKQQGCQVERIAALNAYSLADAMLEARK